MPRTIQEICHDATVYQTVSVCRCDVDALVHETGIKREAVVESINRLLEQRQIVRLSQGFELTRQPAVVVRAS